MMKYKPRGYWTKETCAEEALKYTTRNAFKHSSNVPYKKACQNDWMDDICGHMIIMRHHYISCWTKERCHEEALKYKTRSELSSGSCYSYRIACQNDWLDDICGHMIPLRRSKGYWTKERCHEEALKYKTRKSFSLGSCSGYSMAHKNNWIDDICGHMTVVGNRHKRCIYAILFPSLLKAYTGLSGDPKKRLNQHHNNSSNPGVRRLLTDCTSYENKIYDGWYTQEEAPVAEQTRLEALQAQGYTMLNMIKTGGLGGSVIKWTKETCAEEALKYKTRNAFCVNSAAAYVSATHSNWIDDICGHMVSRYKPNGYWTKERCHEEALKYKTRNAFKLGNGKAYTPSVANGWLDDICGHMVPPWRPNGYWTKERCHEEAKKYASRGALILNCNSAYTKARIHGWLDDICGHMIATRKPNGYWDIKEHCVEESLKYNTRNSFRTGSCGAHTVARRNGWLDEFFPK